MVPMADRDMRYVIARSFGLIETRAQSVLTRFLGDEDCDVVRAARSLGRIGEETAVGPLLQKIQEVDSDTQRVIVSVRGNWKYPTVNPARNAS